VLHRRGVLAGAGSAASLVAASVASLLFAGGLIAFSAWPSAGGSSVPSVTVPASPATGSAPGVRAVPVGAAAVVLPAATSPAGRRGARQVAGSGPSGGSVPSAAAGAGGGSVSGSGAAPATGATPDLTKPQPAPVADGVQRIADAGAGATSGTTGRAGSAVGGPAGQAVQGAGEQVAQAVRDAGGAAADLIRGVAG
jgi:hypothetical protein